MSCEVRLTFWWLGGVLCDMLESNNETTKVVYGDGRVRTVRKDDLEFEKPAFPHRLLLAWYTGFPPLQVHDALAVAHGLCEEAEWVVATPLFPNLTLNTYAVCMGRIGALPLLREPVHA